MGLISSLVSEPASADEESHIVDSPTDAEVDVGVKLSAASSVDASPKIRGHFFKTSLILVPPIWVAMVASIPLEIHT